MAPGINLSVLASERTLDKNATMPRNSVRLPNVLKSSGTDVLHPALVTTDFDELRFNAAASRQLDLPTRGNADVESRRSSSFLISSPYNISEHYLDLNELDMPNRIFAKALTALQPTGEDYAIASYTTALNFDIILELIRKICAAERVQWTEQSFYVVIFRSKLNDDIDTDLLYKLDFESHREACESGGLLKYWFGKPNPERQNLATCFWRSREDAHKGGLGPWHAKARTAGRQMFEHIRFSTNRFTVLDGARDFRFEEWKH